MKKAKNTATIRCHIIITAKGTTVYSTQVRLVGLNDDWEKFLLVIRVHFHFSKIILILSFNFKYHPPLYLSCTHLILLYATIIVFLVAVAYIHHEKMCMCNEYGVVLGHICFVYFRNVSSCRSLHCYEPVMFCYIMLSVIVFFVSYSHVE